MMRPSRTSAMGLLTGSSRPTFRGIRNRKAAFPEPYNFASLMNDLVRDFWRRLVSETSLLLESFDWATHIYSVSPKYHVASRYRTVRKLDLALFRVQVDNPARSLQLCWRSSALLRRHKSLELLMKIYPVAEQPWVLPLLVWYRAVNVLEYLARVGALLDSIEPHCAEFFSKDAPSPQDAIAVGLEVDCCTRFIGKTGLFVKLAGTLVEEVVRQGVRMSFALFSPQKVKFKNEE